MENKLTVQNNYSIAELETMSKKVAQSNFLGTRNESEIFTLFMIAQAEGKNPVQASMEYSIIQGKPALKSQATLIRFQKAGGKVTYLKRDDTECTIKFEHPQAGELTVSWTLETANKAGLNTNRDNWKKYPRQMLAARCIAEGVRALYPACLDGLYLVEEVQDFDNKDFNKNNVVDAEASSIDNSVYDIETNTYSNKDAIEEAIVGYSIVPAGKNKGKKWEELDITSLANAIKYYASQGDGEQYIGYIEKVLNEKLSICPVGISKGCKWEELSTEKLESYYNDYKSGKLIGYADEYASYIEKILIERKSKQSKNANNVKANEDEDPFNDANGDDWDDMINEQENNDKNLNQIDHENENPFDIEDDKTLDELIAEQEKNNLNQIDDDKKFKLEN